jgi:hypothetical protein
MTDICDTTVPTATVNLIISIRGQFFNYSYTNLCIFGFLNVTTLPVNCLKTNKVRDNLNFIVK